MDYGVVGEILLGFLSLCSRYRRGGMQEKLLQLILTIRVLNQRFSPSRTESENIFQGPLYEKTTPSLQTIHLMASRTPQITTNNVLLVM